MRLSRPLRASLVGEGFDLPRFAMDSGSLWGEHDRLWEGTLPGRPLFGVGSPYGRPLLSSKGERRLESLLALPRSKGLRRCLPASQRRTARGSSNKNRYSLRADASPRVCWAAGCGSPKERFQTYRGRSMTWSPGSKGGPLFCDGDFWHGRDWRARAAEAEPRHQLRVPACRGPSGTSSGTGRTPVDSQAMGWSGSALLGISDPVGILAEDGEGSSGCGNSEKSLDDRGAGRA